MKPRGRGGIGAYSRREQHDPSSPTQCWCCMHSASGLHVCAPDPAKGAGGQKERMKPLACFESLTLQPRSGARMQPRPKGLGTVQTEPASKRRKNCAPNLVSIACLTFLLTCVACSKSRNAAAATSPDAASTASTSTSAPSPSDSANPPTFDSSRAMQYVKEIVAFGPRPIGSESHRKVEKYIVSHLKGVDVERDDFEVTSSEGRFPIHNIIAKFPGSKDGIIVIASHYDTNWPLRNIPYVGANDGASSSALLLEIANQLRGKKLEGYSVWLLWDDGEESMKLPWDDAESLYGVRHLAQKWQDDGTLKKIKAFILEDMIGDADLNIDRITEATPWLEDLIFQAATRVGYQSHFFAREISAEDDYRPFIDRGVPSVDLIDFDYGYNNVFWHTTEDTVDKLSPKSLAIVGTVTLETVRLLNQR
jgi:glutaminyl-peptide cyclotransferase